ncbi:MAG: hypothetical protein JSV44_03840, partial [Candidatus Zixiibacteriota bacterium]
IIGTAHVYLGDSVVIPVIKMAGSEPIAGFDFLIGYNSMALALMGMEPKAIVDDWSWEYFTYGLGDTSDCGPSCRIKRVVAIADLNDGNYHSYADSIVDSSILFNMHFRVTNDMTYDCTFLPINFWWLDCGDNTVAYGQPTDPYLALSRRVYNVEGYDITDEDYAGGFPTPYGALQICLDTASDNTVRFSDFWNGGVDVICFDTIDNRGDVNLNAIAYEIADYVVFLNYLLYGPLAFTISLEGQYRATDINADSQFATINDFVYLERVIEGIMLPYSRPPEKAFPNTSNLISFLETDTSIICSVSFEDSIGGMYLCFYAPDLQSYEDYEIAKFPAIEHMQLGYNTHDDSLIMVISKLRSHPDSIGLSATIAAGINNLFEISYTGNAPLIMHASAAGYLAEYVNLAVTAEMVYAPTIADHPEQLVNETHGGFQWDFDAVIPNGYPEFLSFEIARGPGTIDPVTGAWYYVPLCVETGVIDTLEICVSYPFFPCPQADPALHAVVQLNVNQPSPLPGDTDYDGEIELADIVYIITYIYSSGPEPLPARAVSDVNQDNLVNLIDILYLIDYLYLYGPEPQCP